MDHINIRFQISAILFLTIIVFNYIRMEKLPLLSTKCFSFMMAFSVINLIFDFVAILVLTYFDSIPSWIIRLSHQVFIASLEGIMVSLYFYVSALGHRQKRFTKKKYIVCGSPAVVAILFILFSPINYYHEGSVVYCYGIMTYSIYLILFVYLVMIFCDMKRYRNNLRKDQIYAIYAALLTAILISIVQTLHRELLVSGLAISLMMCFLYLAFENPKELMDEDTGMLNKKAFNMMLTEYLASKSEFYVVNVALKDMPILSNIWSQELENKIFTEIAIEMKELTHYRIYHVKGEALSLLVKDGRDEAERICSLIKGRFNNAVVIGEINVAIGLSIHILECPKYGNTIRKISSIINYMIQNDAKLQRKGRIIDVNDEILEQHERELKVQAIVKDAINNDGLEVFYQPIFDINTKRFASAEALVRLKDRTTLGYISPEEFIPIAEKCGLIMELGEIVFRKVCEFRKLHRLEEMGVKYIEVNLSGIQVMDGRIASQLNRIMQETNTPPNFINLEITESASVECKDVLAQNMRKLKDLGCSFSMDDFGTGYSNLSQIAKVEYDLIKLDKSLIWPCFEKNHSHNKARIILDNIVSLIKQMNIKIVAEGVETKEQHDYLMDLGVDYLQGYLYSRPVSTDDFIEYLEQHQEYGIIS